MKQKVKTSILEAIAYAFSIAGICVFISALIPLIGLVTLESIFGQYDSSYSTAIITSVIALVLMLIGNGLKSYERHLEDQRIEVVRHYDHWVLMGLGALCLLALLEAKGNPILIITTVSVSLYLICSGASRRSRYKEEERVRNLPPSDPNRFTLGQLVVDKRTGKQMRVTAIDVKNLFECMSDGGVTYVGNFNSSDLMDFKEYRRQQQELKEKKTQKEE